MRKAITLLCLLIGIGWASAQTKVSGTVISADDGQPVIGATVLVKGTSTGTITDANGKYSINLPANAKTLIFSYVGMTTVEQEAKSSMKIVLQSDSKQMSEVVVTALGITKEKKALGYAVQDVKSDDLNRTSQLNVANALQGKVSGVQITQAGGAVGASQRILIRGNSSFNSNDPLIVIDGVPMDGGSAGEQYGGTAGSQYGSDGKGTLDTGSGLNDINPNDIENISVLKGGSAALYGMRAGNGVILITTKKGKAAGNKMKINYDGSFTIDNVYHLPKYQNKYGQGYSGSEYYYNLYKNAGYFSSGTSYQDYATHNFTYTGPADSDPNAGYKYVDGTGNGVNDGDDESWGPRLDIGLKIPQYNSPIVNGVRQATDWISHPNNIKDFFQTGLSQSHDIAFSNSSEKGSYRASLGYRDQVGTVPNTDQKRYNISLTGQYNFNKYLSSDFSLTYSKVQSDNLMATGYSSSNPLQSIMQWFGRQVDMKDLKAHYTETDATTGNPYNWIQAFHINPYYNLYNNTNAYDRDRVISKGSLFYKPTDWLKFEGRAGYDFYFDKTFQKVLYSTDCPNGWFRQTLEDRHELNADFIAYFDKKFGDFSVDALAGANYRDMTWSQSAEGATASSGLTIKGLYTMANVAGTPYTSMDNSHIRSNSVYANASVGYASQAYLEVSARNDWSSTINDAFFYPSVSLSWIPTETFSALKSDALSYLKVRANIAQVGNATTSYRTGLNYINPTSEATPTSATINGVGQYYRSKTLNNPNLKPESVNTKEVGVEAAFLKNRIRLDMAYYTKTTSDQIMTVEVAASTGYRYKLINAGKVSNKGLELTLSADVIKNPKGFNWTTTLNWSKDKSKVIELSPGLDTYTINSDWSVYNYAKAGESWGSLYGTGFKTDAQGRVIIGSNGLPTLVSSKKIGDVTPDWLAGWSNEFSYKNLSFGFLLDYRKGGDFFSETQMFTTYTGLLDYTAAGNIRETGVVVGKNVLTNKTCVLADGSANTKTISAQKWFYSYYSNKELDICDGSYLKLREIHLTYTFPKSIISRLKVVEDAKVSLVSSNVAILWLSGNNQAKIDPESSEGSGNTSVGFESNSCPPTRSIGIKFNLTF
ncbi:MAG: SusC/RagA family TonB-linked outer membrane protein [Bacteroidetes bacterium]|nr:SusC/RagA family TonB-linked outer membrane protein [Bacteroidota bacterium]